VLARRGVAVTGVDLSAPSREFARAAAREAGVVLPDGSRERRSSSIRMYTLPELKGQMETSGLRVERVFGDFDGSDFGLTSRRLIAVARRP
jgi:hypothetical protein